MEFLKRIFLNILIGIMLIYIAILFISPDVMMDVFGFRTFIVLSTSMEPVLNVEDLIVTVRTDEEDLQEGDIISFFAYIPELQSKQMVTHYIGEIEDSGNGLIYKTHGTFQEEGDYDDWKDEDGNPYDIQFKDIEGKYLFKVPFVGHLNNLFANQTMVVLIIVNGTILYLLFRYIRRDDDDDYED